MKVGSVDLDSEVLLIAEIGNNHEGDIDLAKKLINLAAESGAHVVKFQTIDPNRLVHQSETSRLKQLERFALSRQQHEILALEAESAGIMFMSTPFYLDAVSWLSEIVPAFKIASGDNNFNPLLETVALTCKPVILSTGMTSYSEVENACSLLRNTWHQKNCCPGLSLLHCVSAYPAPYDDVNLASLDLLRELCDEVGYSDHTLGTEVAVMSVIAGARIIEKHFTIDKNFSNFRDHALSADPNDFKDLSAKVKEASKIFGKRSKTCRVSEQPLSYAARRSVVAKHKLDPGHILQLSDLEWLRPADGLPPSSTSKILGRELKRSVSKGQIITLEMFL